MAIIQIITDEPGQINFPNVRRVRIISSDSLATVTAAGYLNPETLQGYSIYNTDVIDMWYGATVAVGQIVISPGVFNSFVPIIVNGVITLQVNINQLIDFDITATAAELAMGGKVIMVASSGSEQFVIRQLYLNGHGTNFSGGGGDRLGQVTDGTTVYSLIPAATMQSLTNAVWGATALPFPASAAINTPTVAGANLYFAYEGGATDYTTGSLTLSGQVQRVA